MPRYVEQHFLNSAEDVGLKIESRADGLWRIPHVLADLRSDRLDAVRRLGKPEPNYRKITFHKEHLDMNQHLDAVLLGPGQPLYASVDEKSNEKLSSLLGHAGAFIDAMADYPYALHFFVENISTNHSLSGFMRSQCSIGETDLAMQEKRAIYCIENNSSRGRKASQV